MVNCYILHLTFRRHDTCSDVHNNKQFKYNILVITISKICLVVSITLKIKL